MAPNPAGDERSRTITASFRNLAASPELGLTSIVRKRLNLMYQRDPEQILCWHRRVPDQSGSGSWAGPHPYPPRPAIPGQNPPLNQTPSPVSTPAPGQTPAEWSRQPVATGTSDYRRPHVSFVAVSSLSLPASSSEEQSPILITIPHSPARHPRSTKRTSPIRTLA